MDKNTTQPTNDKIPEQDATDSKETKESVDNGQKAVEIQKKLSDDSPEENKADAENWRNEG